MTKIVGSITRGQGHELLNQIENTCKEQGVNPEEVATDLIRENFFGKKIEEYLLSLKEQILKIFSPLKPVISDGRTGVQFLADLKKQKLSVGSYAEGILKTPQFQSSVTNGVTYYPGVIKGEEFSDKERTTENIRKEAGKLGGIAPPAELSLILRLNISDEEIKAMGLFGLIPMHEPINDSDGDPILLGLHASDISSQLSVFRDEPSRKWRRKTGFVFLFPQLLHFSPTTSGSFIFVEELLSAVRSTHQAFFLFHPMVSRCEYTFMAEGNPPLVVFSGFKLLSFLFTSFLLYSYYANQRR